MCRVTEVVATNRHVRLKNHYRSLVELDLLTARFGQVHAPSRGDKTPPTPVKAQARTGPDTLCTLSPYPHRLPLAINASPTRALVHASSRLVQVRLLAFPYGLN